MVYRDGMRGCPVCRDAFTEVRASQDRFARCDRCGGVWLEWVTFNAMHGIGFDRAELEASLAVSVLPSEQWFALFAHALLRMS